MKVEKNFLFIAVFLLMGGCNTTLKDELEVKDEQNSIEIQALYSEIAAIDEKPWRTLDEAISIASEVIRQDRPQMRSSNLREQFKIEVLSFNEGKEVRGDRIMSLIHQCMSAISGKMKVMYSFLGIVVCLNYWLMHQVGHSTSTLLIRIIHFILL